MFQIGPDRRRNKRGGICRDRETEAGNREKPGRKETHTLKRWREMLGQEHESRAVFPNSVCVCVCVCACVRVRVTGESLPSLGLSSTVYKMGAEK